MFSSAFRASLCAALGGGVVLARPASLAEWQEVYEDFVAQSRPLAAMLSEAGGLPQTANKSRRLSSSRRWGETTRIAMAPKKGTKRTAAVAAVEVAPEAKKMKETLKTYGVEKTFYDGLVEALQHPLADVPSSARDMLIACVLEGICVPVNQRHEFQNAYVKMLEQTLQGVLSQLNLKVSDATAEVSRIEAEKAQLQAKVQAALEDLQKATEGEKKGKEDLAEVTRLRLAAKSKLTEQEKLRIEGDAAHETAKTEKVAFDAALAEEFRLLRDGAVEGDEAKSKYQILEKLAQSCGMEASLLTALPTSMMKPPAERGSFDAMVVAQLQEGLSKRIAQLEAQIAQGAPAAQERLKQVEAAQKDLEVAKEKQVKAADIYVETQNVLKSCQDAKKAADKKVTDAEPMLLAAQKALEEAKKELETYQTHNWHCFVQLRDHTVEVDMTEKPKDADIAAPSEAAVATAGA